jgi:hypothetical protein
MTASRASTDGWTEIPATDSQRCVLATGGIKNTASSRAQTTAMPNEARRGSVSSSVLRCIHNTNTPRPTIAVAACQVKK